MHTNGGDQHISLADNCGQILGPGVAAGNGGVRMQGHDSSGEADDVGAPQNYYVFARQGTTSALNQLNAAKRRTADQQHTHLFSGFVSSTKSAKLHFYSDRNIPGRVQRDGQCVERSRLALAHLLTVAYHSPHILRLARFNIKLPTDVHGLRH